VIGSKFCEAVIADSNVLLRQKAPSIADVYITEELQRRAPKKTDYLQEKLALQDLAGRMADHPQEVLPRFVDLAMQMTGGISAGLSLYEESPSPGVFRWQFLRGVLSPFNGATTPRNFSPCGVTLDQNAPVLSTYPERVYDWIADANITVPEVLLVPLYLGGKNPLRTLWIVSGQEGHFDRGHARVAMELASFVGIALRMLQSEQRLQRALAEQETLAKEMSHRVKNLFAMTDGMIRMSAKGAGTKDEMARMLSGRLRALADAHSLVQRSFSEGGEVQNVSDLGTLVRAIVRPHENFGDLKRSRFSIDGPDIPCGERATNGVALVLHEFATNAAKYGALTVDGGCIDINWRQADERLILSWVEHGGPPIIAPPPVRGFGSALAQKMVAGQFGGTLEHDWKQAGLAVTISIPIDSLTS
jgi:two-component sensor histidine kinase